MRVSEKPLQFDFINKEVSVFLQGCSLRCKGCHNPELQDFDGGIDIDFNILYNRIMSHKQVIDKVLIMGGEPLDNDTMELTIFCGMLQTFGFKIILFTGYDIKDVPQIWKNSDITIKYGRYIEGDKPKQAILFNREITLASENQNIV